MAEWQQVVEIAAREAALAEDRARWAEGQPGAATPPFAYRWEHVRAVVGLARDLCREEGGDPEIVVAAAWLHDTRKGLPDHAARGAAHARELLSSTDFPASKIESVAHAIAHHEGLWRAADGWCPPHPFVAAQEPLRPIETAILWDADKLAKIGPTGLLHALAHLLPGPVTTESFRQEVEKWWREEYTRTLASFNTRRARKWGREGYAAVMRFLEALAIESRGLSAR